MSVQIPIRLGEAEMKLIEQLQLSGANRAVEYLKTYGLPSRRVEAYHYTDLKSLLRDIPELARKTGDVGTSVFQVPNAFKVLIVNGEIQQSETPSEGVDLTEMDGSCLSDREDVLVMLNRALVDKTLVVRLEGAIDPILHIDHRATGDASHIADALKIEVADGASVTVLETFSGSDEAHVGNHGTSIELGKDAHMTHIVVDQSSDSTRHFNTIEYGVGEGVQVRSLIVNSGSKLSRTQIFGGFSGENAHGDFTGLNLVDDGQHSDITMDITHAVPNTTSQEMFKSVVRNSAKAVFQGRIVVAPKAQKTDAKMMAQGLMLSEGAQILTKPELEIFADDVQCGHGSTCGELDADSLFYLMSRGVPHDEAKAMLIRAFIQELLDPITNGELNSALSSVVEDWLNREQGEAPR